MAKDWAKSFYNSSAWQKCRDGYIQSVNGLCERCLEDGKFMPGYIVHHKTLLTPENISDPGVTLNWEHLEYVCHDCHNKEHHGSGEGATADGLMFDKHGNIIQSPL